MPEGDQIDSTLLGLTTLVFTTSLSLLKLTRVVSNLSLSNLSALLV